MHPRNGRFVVLVHLCLETFIFHVRTSLSGNLTVVFKKHESYFGVYANIFKIESN